MVTAELAVAIPTLMAVLGLALGAVRFGTDTLRCHDAAAVTARLLARGEDPTRAADIGLRAAPRGATAQWEVRDAAYVVTVRSAGVVVGLGAATGSAVAHDEATGALP